MTGAVKKGAAKTAAPAELAVCIRATTSRAPYTRGGIRFASRREPVDLPESTTPDQFRRLVADTAITLTLVDTVSGKSVELPRDLFDDQGEPDAARFDDIREDLLKAIAGASTEPGEAA